MESDEIRRVFRGLRRALNIWDLTWRGCWKPSLEQIIRRNQAVTGACHRLIEVEFSSESGSWSIIFPIFAEDIQCSLFLFEFTALVKRSFGFSSLLTIKQVLPLDIQLYLCLKFASTHLKNNMLSIPYAISSKG